MACSVNENPDMDDNSCPVAELNADENIKFEICVYDCPDIDCLLPHPVSSMTEIDEDFLCGICQELMIAPMCCIQGHSWCKSCINQWLEKNETCPDDRQPLTSETLTRNRIVENMIGKQFNLTCNWKKQGCEWVGHRRVFNKHSPSCEYRLIPCEYCAINIQARNMDEHKKHCDEYPMKCNLGCEWSGVRREFEEHVSVCTHPVPCPYASIGCNEMTPRCELGTHVADYGFHFPLMFKKIEEQERVNEVQARVNEEQARQIAVYSQVFHVQTLLYFDGSQYDGQVRYGNKHGQGVMTYADGSQYNGDWNLGNRQGQGVMTYSDGSTYDGMWNSDQRSTFSCRESRGSTMFGKKYRRSNGCGCGQCKLCLCDSVMTSVMTYADGSKYDGEWINDRKDGRGVMTYADGSKYDGEWIRDRKDGRGVMTYADGTKYDGNWIDDKKQGRGVMTYADGSTYSGELKDDRKYGRGVMTYADGTKYDGEWIDDKKQGRGFMTYADCSTYRGELKDDKKHGKGVMNYADGSRYDGQWKDDRKV